MPYIDFSGEDAAGALEGHDLCIVGAGAAGILLAVRLSQQGRRVLMIETGSMRLDDERQALNQIEQSAKRMGDPVWNRKRVVGGTTTAWGGQSLPFTPIDFAARDWVPYSGWPFGFGELAPHYAAANAFMGIDPWNYHSDLYARFGVAPPMVDGQVMEYHYSKWARQPDFRKLHDTALRAGVTVLHSAHLARIDLGEDGRVAALTIADFAGRRRRLAVGLVILAAGGLETNRILLLNDHQAEGGLGGASGWLGRAFMDHPAIAVGGMRPRDPKAFQRLFATRLLRLRRYSARLSASRQWQESGRMLNVSAALNFNYPAGRDPLDGVKRLLRGRDPRGIADIVRNLPRVAASAGAVAGEGFFYKPGSVVTFGLNVEQEPARESYIALAQERDRFGLRKLRLHWTISPNSWRTAVAFAQGIKAQVEKLGLAEVTLDPKMRFDNPRWHDEFSDVNHHMGGTRMSSSAADGVVDPNLRVWGIPNLYVASSSVFPTSSHSNPTLTLLALCERLARKLAAEPPPGPPSRLVG